MATKTNDKKIKYKGSHKALVINLIIICLVGAFSGFLIGMYYISNKVDPNLYNIDVTKLYDNIGEIKNEAVGKTPLQLGAVKSAALAFDNTFNAENILVIAEGEVKAPMGINQSIDSKSVRIGGKLFSETVSYSDSSMAPKAADRYYMENGSIKHHTGSIDGGSKTVTWNQNNNVMTLKDYEDRNGGGLNEYLLHIVSSKTINSSSTIETLENGNYKFTLKLDKVKSVAKYVKNMKSTGGLSGYPVFEKDIELIVTIDSNFRLVETTTIEQYTAKKAGIPIAATSNGTLTNKFYYEGDMKIPDISEKTVF